jgi:predicted amidohydrolase
MAQEKLVVAVFQLDLVWEDPKLNREKIDRWLLKVDTKPDVVFLPEMFSTGFSMNAERFAETMNGETLQWMKMRSSEQDLAMCGSLIIQEDGKYFNRLVFVKPDGVVEFYNKRHLFTMSHEDSHFEKGVCRLIVEYKGWRICPLICYDLRFPVWARNRNEYDILVYSANWPQSRIEVWDTLLKSRAIENQAYVVGANRVGVDGHLTSYSGNSQLINPKGVILSSLGDHFKGIVTAGFSYSELQKFRTDFPVLNDADNFDIID